MFLLPLLIHTLFPDSCKLKQTHIYPDIYSLLCYVTLVIISVQIKFKIWIVFLLFGNYFSVLLSFSCETFIGTHFLTAILLIIG